MVPKKENKKGLAHLQPSVYIICENQPELSEFASKPSHYATYEDYEECVHFADGEQRYQCVGSLERVCPAHIMFPVANDAHK